MNEDQYLVTPIARAIWEDRYALKDPHGKLQEGGIFDSFGRVSKAIASQEKDKKKWEEAFFGIMSEKFFCPAGRIIANAGTHFSQLLNCYVIPFKSDSLTSIMETAKNMAITQKFGGGCIGGESVVFTNRGPIPIKDLVESPEFYRVLSYNSETYEMEFCDVLDKHTTPMEGNRVYEIEFDDLRGGSAAKMRASDWHPFFVFDGEKVEEVRADELKPGMAVIGSSDLSVGYDPWSWLLGYVAGDGDISCNGQEPYTRVRIVDQYKACIERASDIMEVPFDLSKDPRYEVEVWACESYAGVAEDIKEEFGGYQTCDTKHIPKSIWCASPEKRFSFLVGYFDADGSFNKEKKRFEAFSVSKDLAYGVLALAGSLGIRASVRFRKSRKENERDGWEVRLTKSQYISNCVSELSAKYDISDVNFVNGPVNFSNKWKDRLLKATGINVRTDAARRGRTEIGPMSVSLAYWLQHGKATRETASTIIRECGQKELAQAVLSCQIVKSSKPTNTDETLYDLTVDKNQTYVASDPTTGAYVVVHNTGFNYSTLRPEGSYIKGVNGHSCGVIGFIDMMSVISGVIEQGGSRRGANMGILEIDHPDVWKFVSYKNEHEWDRLREFMTILDPERWEYFKKDNAYKLQMYNVSIGITDEFLEALRNDRDWSFKWNGDDWDLYKVIYKNGIVEKEFEVVANSEETANWKVKRIIPYPKSNDIFEVVSKRKIKASEIWEKVCYNAWANGCPGLIYISEAKRMHNGEYCSPLLGCNPCGEQMLPPMGSCNLGALVLSSFVKRKGGKTYFDFETLKDTVRKAIRFHDNVIDNCEFPLPEMKKLAMKERRVGLGTMGVHDMLIGMELGYDTEEGRAFTEKVLTVIRDEAYRASIEIAKEKGSFPLFDADKYLESPYVKRLPEDIQDDIRKYGIRNVCLLTQAPTGTTGTMLSVSTGCEPWFAMTFDRHTGFGSYVDGCQNYIKWSKEHPDEDKPSYFKTSMEIAPEDHLKMMILFTKFADSAVSKTINLPNESTVDDVNRVFLKALDNGVKGITVFRDGCRMGVLRSKDKPESDKKGGAEKTLHDFDEVSDADVQHSKPRGNRVVGATNRIHMENHNMYITVNKNPSGEVVEVFATVGESKNPNAKQTSGVEDSWAEGLGKIISLGLRAGVLPSSIIRNLKNIPSDKPVFSSIGECDSEYIPSPPHAIARVMEEEIKYTYPKSVKKEDLSQVTFVCSSCGSDNTKPRSSTCYDCLDCGYSGCGGG